MDDEKNNKDIEIVQGIGNLDISPVYENTTSAKPKMQDEKPKDIVIPQIKKHIEEKDDIDEEQNIDNNEDIEDVSEEISEEVEEDEDVFEDQIQFDDFDDLNSDENNNEE